MPAKAPHLLDLGPLEVEFGSSSAEVVCAPPRTALRLPVPVMGSRATEGLFGDLRDAGESHGFFLRESDDLLVGCSVTLPDRPLAEAALDLYRRMFAARADRFFYRIWNYVPAINSENAGVENYRAFCVGRSRAFEAAHGAGFKQALPAASGVGCEGGALAVVFVAGREAPRHVENPSQVSAYEYPPEHGERPPSFARATIATQNGRPLVFISGTAAIKGHATVAPHSLPGQLDCTLDNLRIIGKAAGVGESLGADLRMDRHFKVYLRRAGDFARVRARLERELLRPEDRTVYLRADICRAALDVEIEATLAG